MADDRERFAAGNSDPDAAAIKLRVCGDCQISGKRKVLTVGNGVLKLLYGAAVRIRRREQAGAQDQAQQQRQPNFTF